MGWTNTAPRVPPQARGRRDQPPPETCQRCKHILQFVFSLLPRHWRWHWHMRALRRQGHCHETRVQEGVAKRTAYPRAQGAATPWLQSQRVSRKPSANALLSSQRKRRHRLTRACAYADEPQANVFYEEARSSAIIHTCAPAPAPARVAFARLSACVPRHRIRSSSLGVAASFATHVQVQRRSPHVC